jgi:NAD dependent epimerase/dehydratase family enzyme
MLRLREALGRSVGLPATRWMLEIGAFFMRSDTELLLKSRRVVPGRLLSEGFTFEYDAWGAAARELVSRRA